jgi:hypothetical protein|tara:strand:- start:2071 stop:2607 length:537 start_codon:yes stop_codon:yes gene_type:complete
MGTINFDASTVEPQGDQAFDPMPPGWYHATIINSDMLVGKSPDAGEMLRLTVEIDGNHHAEYASRQVFHYMCINHKSEQTRYIARAQLSAICHATNTLELEDSDQLLGANILARLKIRPARDGYEASNDVASYAAIDSQKTMRAPKPAPAVRKPTPAEKTTSTDNAEKPVGPQARAWK